MRELFELSGYSSGIQNITDPCENPWNSTCDTATINGFEIQSPELIPTCILAALIGFGAYCSISKTNVRGSKIYALTFFMFGTMMSDAAFNDCILAVHGDMQDLLHIVVGIIDVGLTSSIGLTFAFNGLVDVGLLTEGRCLFGLLGLLYTGLFAAWYYTFTIGWMNGFIYLYAGVIGVSCGIYCITEVIYLIRSKNKQGLIWVGVAGLTGGFGLAAIMVPSLDLYLCHTFGCHFAGNFLWFLLSDVAMYACYRYFMTRVTAQTKAKDQLQHVNVVDSNQYHHPYGYMMVPLQEINN